MARPAASAILLESGDMRDGRCKNYAAQMASSYTERLVVGLRTSEYAYEAMLQYKRSSPTSKANEAWTGAFVVRFGGQG